jgi:hypothetical protein
LSLSTSAPADEEATPARALTLQQCAQDVSLINVEGSSTYTDETGDTREEGVIYDNIPIVIESQDEPGTVQFKLNTDEFSGFFEEGGTIDEVWMQYHKIVNGDLTCMSETMVPFPNAASETFTAKCVRGAVTLVQLWVVDSGLSSDADNAEVDNCCRKPTEFSQAQPPAVQYTFLLHCETSCDPPPTPSPTPSHGVCQNFSVHARDSVSFAGGITTIYSGDVGVAPGDSISGTYDIVDGEAFTGTSSLDFANSVTAAHAEAMAVQTDKEAFPTEIGGLTFTPGTYRTGGQIQIQSGYVTLDGGGDENAEFLFQAGSSMITAANTYVNLINGAKAENVIWATTSAVTLGANSVVEGSILSGTAISFGLQAELHGCALAQSAVTFSSNGFVKGVYYIDGAVGRTRQLHG